MNDREVIKKVLKGDREVYAVLVDRYKDMAYTIAFRMVNNRVDAEEIVQEAFINAYRKLQQFRQDAAFTTWFYRIVYNGTISYLRSRKIRTSDEPDSVIRDSVEEPEIFRSETEKIRKDAVRWAIAQLKPEDKTIVTLFYHGDKSLREIGEIMDMNEDTVKMRLFRIRKTMKKLLEGKFKGEFAEVIF